MPSERAPWLRSQGLGFFCAQATVVLLGIGSFVVSRTKDGDSSGVSLDELRPFFEHPSLTHAWMYALVPVLVLYGLNTALCTWDASRTRWTAGVRGLAAWGPTVVHVSFLVALVGHLLGGLFNTEVAPVTLDGERYTELGDGRRARVLAVEEDHTPSGKLTRQVAQLEFEGGGRGEVGFNQPLTHGPQELWLLAQVGGLPRRARVVVDGQRCAVSAGQWCGAAQVALLLEAGRVASWPVTLVQLADGTRAMLREGERQLVAGHEVAVEALEQVPVVELRHRLTPGFPWALGGALLLAVGLLMMGARWVRPAPAAP